MNSNLKEIIKILIANIESSKSEFPQIINNKLNHDVKSNEVKELLKHYILHKKNIQISIMACKETHCLECIKEQYFCEHRKVIRLDEKILVNYIYNNIEHLKKLNRTRECFYCRNLVDAAYFKKNSCYCECYYCVLGNYKQYSCQCSICGSSYDNSEILEISTLIYQKVDLYCKSCYQIMSVPSNNSNICQTCAYNS